MSPEIVAALYGRVFAVALQNILWGAVLFLVGTYLCTLATRIYNRKNGDFAEYGWLPIAVAVLVFLITTGLFAGAIGRVNNPDYYVLSLLKNGLFGG
jgi:hypothetical protein